MPQTSDVVQKLINDWFPRRAGVEWGQDYFVHKLLIDKGWTEQAGMFYPPTPSYFGPVEDYILLKYLMEEWDYSWQSTGIDKELILRVGV